MNVTRVLYHSTGCLTRRCLYFLRHTTDDAFLRALADLPLLFAPGERYSYAAGTFVIGRVIENVSGLPYAEFMRTRIFEPLGMTRTMINDASRVVPHRASDYRLHRGELMNGYRISPSAEARGDVGVLTTALDLARWDAAMRDTRLLSRATLDLIATPARLNDGSSFAYGLGWNLWPVRGLRTMSHGGTFRTGFSSSISRYLDTDMTVIVVANLWAVFLDGGIGQEIASFHDPAFRRVSTMQPRSDPDPDRSHMLRSVIGLVARGTVDSARMTEDFPIGEYTVARWQERHEGLQSFSFVDCHPHAPRGVDAGGSAISELCFYGFAELRGTGLPGVLADARREGGRSLHGGVQAASRGDNVSDAGTRSRRDAARADSLDSRPGASTVCCISPTSSQIRSQLAQPSMATVPGPS